MSRGRWLWILSLVILAGACAMVVSVFAVRPADPIVAVATPGLQDVTRKPIPQGVRVSPGKGRTPTAFWLLHDGATWRAFADRDTYVSGCPLEWEPNGQRFVDRCGGSVWDRAGRLVGGPGERNLDEFTVTMMQTDSVSVDLSQLKLGADAPLVVFREYVSKLNARRAEEAWLLVHPDRQDANNHEQYLKRAAQYPLTESYRVEGQQPILQWDDRLKQAGLPGGRTWAFTMQLTVRWDSGTKQEIHLAPDAAGNWRLIWSPAFSLE